MNTDVLVVGAGPAGSAAATWAAREGLEVTRADAEVFPRDIPYGETRTYSDIAEEIGEPAAIRAVGSACGANRVPLTIPCHRVIRTDGSLGGFGWGLEVKEELLAREGSLQPMIDIR